MIEKIKIRIHLDIGSGSETESKKAKMAQKKRSFIHRRAGCSFCTGVLVYWWLVLKFEIIYAV
jgi:hypothetical protein